MRTDRGLTDLAATLADGQAVDWAALEAELGSEAERALFRQLRVIADIAELHRSIPDEDGLDESALTATPAGDTEPEPEPSRGLATTPVGDAAAADEVDLGTWGPYRLLRALGPGTLGRVVRATDHLHRDVVIRFLPTPSAPEVAVAFLATGQALARVRHPNAVEVYGAEQHDDQTGLVMEFVDGRSLDQVVVTQGTFSAREAALVGWELCRAVAALHREGLAHGLLSPDNIVREAGGRLVLMDVWPQGVPIEALDLEAGTLPFLAPEVVSGDPPSGRSDIYGLGVVLFYLVSGAYPVRASSLGDLAGHYERGERTPLADLRPDLPDDFIRIVERACDPDPDRRYSTIAGVKEALSRTLGWDTWTRKQPVVTAAIADTPSSSTAPLALATPIPTAPPRPPTPYGLVAVAVAAIAIGGFVAWSLLPRITGLLRQSASLGVRGAGATTGTPAEVRLALGSATGADPALTPLVIEQLAQDLSSSPPFRVIAPVAVEPMLGQPAAAIMHAVDADVYVDVAVTRRGTGMQARLDVVRAGGQTQSIQEAMTGITPLREFTATLTQRVVTELAATEPGTRPTLRTELPLDNPEAMQAYTLGQARLGRGGRKEVEEAAESFRSATEAAPEFVLAYAKWAEALLSLYRHNALRADEALPLAQSVISKALSLDDRSAEAYAALGDLYAERHNLEQSERHFRRALSLNPSCEYARIRFAMLLAGRGRVEEAVEQVDQAQKLNQRSSLLRGYLGATLHYARRFDEAARTYETLLRLDSQYTAAHIGLCKAYTELRRSAEALAACQSVGAERAAEDPFVQSQLVKIHHDAGRPREAQQALTQLRLLYDARPTGDGAFWIALAYVSLGDTPHALEWLDKSIDANSSRLAYARVDSRLDPIRRDPRFIARMARIDKGTPVVDDPPARPPASR
ncbi:Serine/threonine-protein kinase PrkC [Luteitalea pratensis]|uniref:Serine/threonine-protein kinase PrkC n=1 Tax=Luteitalea pratensis TaxID=1855912 RepID=A0A143PKD9_LUTPR|nr:serine/threonine-protein kinase [Luteitalea pratensis]AMY08234.1 Serine/threonine-protein kinase PrkC [Luteitalea pratensis]